MKKWKLALAWLVSLMLVACSGATTPDLLTGQPSAADLAKIPQFDHVGIVVLENTTYDDVISSPAMPYLNQLAQENVLLEQYFAVDHPSLPNYLALIGGSTFGINKDCIDCTIDEPSLPDLIEESGRTWKTYQEDMPSACFLGDQEPYVQKHNPFVYFDSIRLDPARCQRSVVPLDDLERDLASDALPDFFFISPNLCHSGHDCGLDVVDGWLKSTVEPLLQSPQMASNSLIVVTFDEAEKSNTERCCGLGRESGGHIATVLISPNARQAFRDRTPLTHYSLLKTILLAWGLEDLGATQDARNTPIIKPWKNELSRW